MFDFSKVSKKDIDVVMIWNREYWSNCKHAKELSGSSTHQKTFEYICKDSEKLITLMRSRGVLI